MEEGITAAQQLVNTAIDFGVNYSFQVVGALIVLVIGFIIANSTHSVLLKLFEKKNVDVTLSRFIASIVKVIIIIFALLISLGKFGITIAPFVAALGALTFGASFALQGPLSNYGAGITIILTRPFVVGNTISVAGVSGVVKEVKLACTILTNEDGVTITIPNKHVVGEILHNSAENKVVEGVIGISYASNPDKAIQTVRATLAKFEEVTQTPVPQVGIREFADSSVNIDFRYWVPTVKFFQISHAVNLAIYKALQEANINIPFPQRDVHIIGQASGSPVIS